MNREKFLEELASLLKDIPQAEREDILQYYQDYFDDGGVENEEKIIKELGSPKEVAENIKSGLDNENSEKHTDGENNRQENQNEQTYTRVEPTAQTSNNIPLLICIGIGILLLSPAIISIIATIIGLFVGIFFTGIGLILGGIACLGIAVTGALAELAVSLLTAGIGLVLISIGIGILYLSIKILQFAIPKSISGMQTLYTWLKNKNWR